MTPRDLLDEYEPVELAKLSKRELRRLGKLTKKRDRSDRKRGYHRRVQERRSQPATVAVLVVIVILFAGIWLAGFFNQRDVPAEGEAGERAPVLTYAPPTPRPVATDSAGSPQVEASNWIMYFYTGRDWADFVAPASVAKLDELRAAAVSTAGVEAFVVDGFEWSDIEADATTWTGTIDVRFFGEPAWRTQLRVTVSTETGSPQIVDVQQLSLEPIA